MDRFDSQTFHSFLGFANLIKGLNVKNSGVLAGVPIPPLRSYF